MLEVSTAQEKKQWDPKGEREREERERKLEDAYFLHNTKTRQCKITRIWILIIKA
jgi:hypothetical protein